MDSVPSDPYAPYDEEQRAKLGQWLRANGALADDCPSCHRADPAWHATGFIKQPIYPRPQDTPAPRSAFLLLMTCGYCGFAMQFGAPEGKAYFPAL